MVGVTGSYNSCISSYGKDSVQKKETENTAKTGRASGQTTQDYIKGLEEKYGVNITVGKNTTGSSFMNYMMGSSGGNNVYIEKNMIDKMASDPAVAAKYEELIARVPEEGKQAEQDIKELSNGEGTMIASGMQIHKNGKVTYWGVAVYNRQQAGMGTELRKKAQETLEKQQAAKKERIHMQERLQEKRAEQAEKQEKLVEKRAAEAESREELLSEMLSGTGKVTEGSAMTVKDGKGLKIDMTV